MAYDDNNSNNNITRQDAAEGRSSESLFSKRVKAGKRRTYFFDVRATRGNDYFITITESKKRFEDGGYDRHKMFLYKEDFNKFLAGLTDTINYVKTDLMPDFDFDSFSHENDEEYVVSAAAASSYSTAANAASTAATGSTASLLTEAPLAVLDAPVMLAETANESSIEDWKM